MYEGRNRRENGPIRKKESAVSFSASHHNNHHNNKSSATFNNMFAINHRQFSSSSLSDNDTRIYFCFTDLSI